MEHRHIGQHTEQPGGEQHAEPGGCRHDEAQFRQHLGGEARPAGAEGRADGEFAGLMKGPDHHQVGKIGARNEENAGHHGGEDQVVALGGGGIAEPERRGVQGHRGEILRAGGVQDRRVDRGELGPELFHGGARPETGDHHYRPDRGPGARVERRNRRHPEHRADFVAEPGWHDPDDGVAAVGELDGLADDVRVAAQLILAEFVAEHGGQTGAEPVVFGGKDPPLHRRDPEHVEQLI